MKQLHFFHFISIHDCISYFIQDTTGQRNIKIILLQMILYPVALFQQKIVITNKILHLSPKLCLWVSFIHFTLSSVRNIFSLLLCNIQLSAQSIHLIQFNTDLWTRENKTARSTKWQEIKGILIKQTVQRHKPASHLLSAIAVTSSPNPNTESWGGGSQ